MCRSASVWPVMRIIASSADIAVPVRRITTIAAASGPTSRSTTQQQDLDRQRGVGVEHLHGEGDDQGAQAARRAAPRRSRR